MKNKLSKDEYYLGVAKAISKGSPCLRRQYGAIIVKNDEIIATGYNGVPRGELHCDICTRAHRTEHNTNDYSDCRSVHAEMNAMISAARRNMIGATLYLAGFQDEQSIKSEPCEVCNRIIKNAGIIKIVGSENYEFNL